MRTIITGLSLMLVLLAKETAAADVAYQLDAARLPSIDVPQPPQPQTFEIKERTWAAPGLEEAVGDDFSNTGRCRIFVPPSPAPIFKVPDPLWSQNELWPRTRERWGRGEYYRTYTLPSNPSVAQR